MEQSLWEVTKAPRLLCGGAVEPEWEAPTGDIEDWSVTAPAGGPQGDTDGRAERGGCCCCSDARHPGQLVAAALASQPGSRTPVTAPSAFPSWRLQGLLRPAPAALPGGRSSGQRRARPLGLRLAGRGRGAAQGGAGSAGPPPPPP